MPDVPASVARAYESIKGEYPYFVSLKKIHGKYFYLYKQSVRWDKEEKKRKTVSKYLGKITPDGRFIKKMPGLSKDLGRAMAVIESYGGTVVLPEKRESELQATALEQGISEIDDRLLTVLSMNARADLSYFGKQMGLTASATYSRVRHLEQKYGIGYVPEIDIRKLGYLTYMIFVKFAEQPPSADLTKEALKKEPIIQLALLTQGRYDIVMYATVENSDEARTQIYELQARVFPTYEAEWHVVPFYPTYGFVPLRQEFFDLLAQSVWKRTKEQPRKRKGQLTQKEYIVLRELNADGAAKFSEIDRKHGFVGEGAAYTYRKLIDTGLLKRVTMTMRRLPMQYTAMLLADITNRAKYATSREKLLKGIIEKTATPTDRYALVGDRWTPFGVVFVVPIFGEVDLEKAEGVIKSRIDGIQLDRLIVLGTSIGSMCFRRFDNNYSNQHRLLVEEYKMKDSLRMDYTLTGKGGMSRILGENEDNLAEEDS